MSLERILQFSFLFLTLSTGLWCVISPESVIRFRRRMKWSESKISGGYHYATKPRTRAAGSFVVLISAVCLYLSLR